VLLGSVVHATHDGIERPSPWDAILPAAVRWAAVCSPGAAARPAQHRATKEHVMATKMPKQAPRPGATTPPTPKPAGGKPIVKVKGK
jgi:hypothetical protein